MKAPYVELSDITKFFDSLYGEISDEQIARYKRVFSAFKERFSANFAYIASSGGRVELLGNHTDHNGGRVLSSAISLDSLAFFLPNGEDVIRIFSEGYGDITVDLRDHSLVEKGTTAALIKGVLQGFLNYGFKIGGFNAYVSSNVLNGSGVSSSASFEVLICEILNFLFNDDKVDNECKAKISQFAEREFFGKPCGLLDQTAIAFGGLNKLDFGDENKIKVERVDADLKGYSLILINTGSSHENLTDEYASIPREMKQVAKLFGKNRLIEVDEESFYGSADVAAQLSDRAVMRAIHFFEENKRVDTAAEALVHNDYKTFLNCIRESGVSSWCKLQNCYVGGSSEQQIPRALSVSERYLNGGANRVHGGGFGGTILNIVKNENVEEFIKNTERFYGRENILVLKVRKIGTIVL